MRNNGTTRNLWLHLLKEGGRTQSGEAARDLSLDIVDAAQSCYRMAENGMAKRYEVDGVVMFGVTKDCKIPRGVTLGELVEAGVLKEPA